MPQLDKQTVKDLSLLCRIHCSETEQETLLHDLKNILDYVEGLQAVNTEGVDPCVTVLPTDLSASHDAMREDEIGDTLPREAFLSNVPVHLCGMVVVPPVIK